MKFSTRALAVLCIVATIVFHFSPVSAQTQQEDFFSSNNAQAALNNADVDVDAAAAAATVTIESNKLYYSPNDALKDTTITIFIVGCVVIGLLYAARQAHLISQVTVPAIRTSVRGSSTATSGAPGMLS
jgi:hypothetical protein